MVSFASWDESLMVFHVLTKTIRVCLYAANAASAPMTSFRSKDESTLDTMKEHVFLGFGVDHVLYTTGTNVDIFGDLVTLLMHLAKV